MSLAALAALAALTVLPVLVRETGNVSCRMPKAPIRKLKALAFCQPRVVTRLEWRDGGWCNVLMIRIYGAINNWSEFLRNETKSWFIYLYLRYQVCSQAPELSSESIWNMSDNFSSYTHSNSSRISSINSRSTIGSPVDENHSLPSEKSCVNSEVFSDANGASYILIILWVGIMQMLFSQMTSKLC